MPVCAMQPTTVLNSNLGVQQLMRPRYRDQTKRKRLKASQATQKEQYRKEQQTSLEQPEQVFCCDCRAFGVWLTAGVGGADANPIPPNAPPPNTAGVAGASGPPLPKIETRSSSGLLDVPASRPTAAGVCASTCVAARPDGWPSRLVASSKSLRRERAVSTHTRTRGRARVQEVLCLLAGDNSLECLLR